MRADMESLASKIESAGASHPPYDGNALKFCRGGVAPPIDITIGNMRTTTGRPYGVVG